VAGIEGSRNNLGVLCVDRVMKAIRSRVGVLALALFIVNAGLAQQPSKPTVVGDLRIERFQSNIFDRMITVRVWLPEGYADISEATKKYPTLYMLDG